MRKIFNYTKFSEERLNTLVESFGALCDAVMNGKADTAEYKEANRVFNESFMRECASAMPSYNEDTFTLEDMKNPMVHKNLFLLERFDTILAQAISPVVPTVVAQGYENLYDVTQVGWGDNAKYFVESNEMFVVNDIAEGIARGGVQTMYNTEYTVQARPKQVSVYVDWYHVAS